jgi:dTDP-4-dehydrorhamnose 3,5-epimerase
MKIIEIKSLEIPEIKVIKFEKFKDERGYFTEPFRKTDFQNQSELKSLHNFTICQANQSFSKKNVVRGLHFQWNPYMGKLVRTIKGKMIDVVLDIRKDSPTFGKIVSYELSSNEENEFEEWIWVPVGFAHGNIYLEDTIIEYFCSGEYSPNYETGISILSEDLDWSFSKETKEILDNLKEKMIISEKDKNAQGLSNWTTKKEFSTFEYNDLINRNLC